MHFTTLALSALSIGSAFAADAAGGVTVHVVKVGSANGTLKYSPNSLTAAKGDMVQFQFAPANHTVTQSTFDQPCQPIAMNSNVTGIYSGFMPVSATATDTPTYTIMVKDTKPMWFYCSQGKHCQNGMTMVINVNPKANATRTLENFQALAKKATANLPGSSSSTGGGTSGSTPASGTGSGSDSGTGTGSSSSSSSAPPNSASSATSIKTSYALTMGAALAVGMALFM